MDWIEFWTICSSNGIILEKEQIDQFKRYCDELIYWNKQINLISRKDEENLLEKHILHSLAALKYIDFPKKARCLDVGTGGGLPGIPILIARNDLFMTLTDSIAKKIKMTEMFAQHTGIKTVKAMNVRVEELGDNNNYRQFFDIILSRGVAQIETIISWIRKILKRDGTLILYKGGDLEEEIEIAQHTYSDFKIQEIPIKMIGSDWFEQDEKKLIICSYKNDK